MKNNLKKSLEKLGKTILVAGLLSLPASAQAKQVWELTGKPLAYLLNAEPSLVGTHLAHPQAKVYYYPDCDQASIIEKDKSIQDTSLDTRTAREFESTIVRYLAGNRQETEITIFNIFRNVDCVDVRIADADKVANVYNGNLYIGSEVEVDLLLQQQKKPLAIIKRWQRNLKSKFQRDEPFDYTRLLPQAQIDSLVAMHKGDLIIDLSDVQLMLNAVRDSISLPQGRYLLKSPIYVEKEGTVTIAPGSEWFMDKNAAIISRGKLQAIGTESQNIVFTALDDQWNNITLLDQQKPRASTLDWCVIQKGTGMSEGILTGKTDTDSLPNTMRYGGGLYIARSKDVKIENCLVQNNTAELGGGIAIQQSDIWLAETKIEGNSALFGAGLVSTNSRTMLVYCSLERNTTTPGNIRAFYGFDQTGQGDSSVKEITPSETANAFSINSFLYVYGCQVGEISDYYSENASKDLIAEMRKKGKHPEYINLPQDLHLQSHLFQITSLCVFFGSDSTNEEHQKTTHPQPQEASE